MVEFFMRALFLGALMKNKLCGFSYKGINPILRTSSNPKYVLKTSSPNTIPLGAS